MNRLASTDHKQQLFLRSMANGVMAERDRLLQYTIGEFYQEMSLFITEMDMKKKELEKLGKK